MDHGSLPHDAALDQLEDVLILSCGGAYNYPFRARYPSLQEIQAALGDYANISLR